MTDAAYLGHGAIPISDPLLRRREVERETGLSRTSIYRQMDDGDFPRPLRIGRRAVAWRASEISKWKDSRASTDRST